MSLPPTTAQLPRHRLGDPREPPIEHADDRKRGGVYYTPPDVVSRLLDLTLEPLMDACGEIVERVRAIRVLDPACGSGNFLAAAGYRIQRRLEELGVPPSDAAAMAFGECVVGIDVDPTAVRLCTTRLSHASHRTVSADQLDKRIVCADALDMVAEAGGLFNSGWRSLRAAAGASDGFDLVIGNPPFLSQLASQTARSEGYSARLRRHFGSAVSGLTDTAVLFLLLAVEAAKRDGGVVCLIQPLSVLSARDAAGARRSVLAQAGMRAAWICEDQVFDASVRVCASVFVRDRTTAEVELFHNRKFDSAGSVPATALSDATWSQLLASTKGVPDRELRSAGIVRDIASATADFRDQYYGLRGCVVDLATSDDSAFPPLVTSGLLDPAEVLWGRRPTKFDKVKYECPRVDVSRLEPRLQDWARERLRPKLMLATQTRVLEAFVDFTGRFLPSVPVVTITANDVADLWRLGALLSSPPITLVAARRHMGSALSSEALKLGGSDVLGLPLPADEHAWTLAAEHFRRACVAATRDIRSAELQSSATSMCEAFGLNDDAELLAWWTDRLPTPRGEG